MIDTFISCSELIEWSRVVQTALCQVGRIGVFKFHTMNPAVANAKLHSPTPFWQTVRRY